jgi:serine/threonine-protein phosphatase CPPED1
MARGAARTRSSGVIAAAWRRTVARLVAVLCLGFAAGSVQADGFEPFEFALVGDPQIGYGPGAEYADAARFGHVVDDIAARGFPLTVVAGDLVQDRSLWQHWAYGRVARRLPGQVLLVPGNHDIVDRSTLAAWRERHGPDYRDAVHANVAFVLLDSETLRDGAISPSENTAQWAFLESALAAHVAARRNHIVLVVHRPPFVDSEDEAEGGHNWPPESRSRLLALARTHGVRWILAGHLHRTTVIEARDGLRIVVGAGSARSFDRSPIAYHRFRVEREALHFEQVVVAPPPAEPFAVRGLSGWTPRLFEFSVRHWILTALYAAVAVLTLQAARRDIRSADPEGARLWWAVTLALLLFGANMQLDFDELISETGRIAAKVTGLYALRHVITATSAVALAALALFLFLRYWRRARGHRAPLAALAGLTPPAVWFSLSAMSHHDIGMLFNEGWWDLLTLGGLVFVAVCAMHRRSVPDRASHASVAVMRSRR